MNGAKYTESQIRQLNGENNRVFNDKFRKKVYYQCIHGVIGDCSACIEEQEASEDGTTKNR